MTEDEIYHTAENICGIVGGIVIGALVLIFVIAVIRNLTAKEYPQVITVVRRHENSFRYRLPWAWSSYSSIHYAVECTYPGSEKLHKLVCNGYAEYEKLVSGKTYTVTLKQYRIISVIKKHKRK